MEYKRFDKDWFSQEFSKSEIYQQLVEDYSTLYSEVTDISDLKKDDTYSPLEPYFVIRVYVYTVAFTILNYY